MPNRYLGPFWEGYLWWNYESRLGKAQWLIRRVRCCVTGHVPYAKASWKYPLCRRCGQPS